MTIPVLSTEPIIGRLLSPDNMPKRPTIDYEMGGIALQDPSQGLIVQQWRAWFERQESAVFVESATTPATKIFDQPNIVWLSFCFDQNMRWCATYTLYDGHSYLRWYNAVIGNYDITELQTGVVSPFLSMDDKRAQVSGLNDILLTYLRANPAPDTKQTLYMRAQRERFAIEHALNKEVPQDWIIRNFGMSNKLRMQWEIR